MILDAADDINALYATPILSTRTGSLYNAFSYPTKISPEAVALFIACHTGPNEVVLDAFAGSGTTGLAAMLCDIPTPRMIQQAQELGLRPNWGPRTAILKEVGNLGAFLSETMCHPPNSRDFAIAAKELISEVRAEIGWMYESLGDDGRPLQLSHAIWSEFLICPQCGSENSYWSASIRFSPVRFEKQSKCSSCPSVIEIDQCERSCEEVHDSLTGAVLVQRKRRMVQIYCGTKAARRPPNQFDLDLIERIARISVPSCVPIVELDLKNLRRSGYHQGITHVHHFYTRRNLIANAFLWEAVQRQREHLQPALKLLCLSYNAAHSTIMSRVVAKKNSKELVLTGAQSGVLYVSALPVEKNVLNGVERKINTFCDAFEIVGSSRSKVSVFHSSSEQIELEDASVNYVFTDPPFGDFIPYAEANQISEAWLGEVTDRSSEIIVSPSEGKPVGRYGEMMSAVFAEIGRVMKAGASATVVFHAAKADVWKALADAIKASGLAIRAASVLDKVQATFMQTNAAMSVKGDPMFLLRKETDVVSPTAGLDALEVVLREAEIAGGDELKVQRIFARYVSYCLARAQPVTLDFKSFYARVMASRAFDEV